MKNEYFLDLLNNDFTTKNGFIKKSFIDVEKRVNSRLQELERDVKFDSPATILEKIKIILSMVDKFMMDFKNFEEDTKRYGIDKLTPSNRLEFLEAREAVYKFYNKTLKKIEVIKVDIKSIDIENIKNNKQFDSKSIALGAVGGVAAAGAGLAAYKIISNILSHMKWKKEGCDKILDSERKSRCKTYVTGLEIKALSKEIEKCKNDSCRESIQKRIQYLQK